MKSFFKKLYQRIKTFVFCRNGHARRHFIGQLSTLKGTYRILQCPRCGTVLRRKVSPPDPRELGIGTVTLPEDANAPS